MTIVFKLQARNPSSASTVSLLHGFTSPSPTKRLKSSTLSTVQEQLLSEDSQSPRVPHCQDHFTPNMMSTLTPGAKNWLREKEAGPSFKPCHFSTEKDFKLPAKIPASGQRTPDIAGSFKSSKPIGSQNSTDQPMTT